MLACYFDRGIQWPRRSARNESQTPANLKTVQQLRSLWQPPAATLAHIRKPKKKLLVGLAEVRMIQPIPDLQAELDRLAPIYEAEFARLRGVQPEQTAPTLPTAARHIYKCNIRHTSCDTCQLACLLCKLPWRECRGSGGGTWKRGDQKIPRKATGTTVEPSKWAVMLERLRKAFLPFWRKK